MDVCPRTCPTEGAACFKYTRWFRRTSLQCARPVHELPANPRKVLQLLRFRLGCHTLPSATGQRRNPRVPRDQRICTRCQHGLGDERHLVFECTKLQHIRDRYALLFEGCDRMQSFMSQGSQKDVMNFVSDCLRGLRCAARWCVGVNRGGQTRRKALIHRWGFSTRMWHIWGNLLLC